MRAGVLAAGAVVAAAAACNNNTDPRWQLRHDRIVAIRLTPAHVAAGQVAVLDALVTSVDGGLAVQPPVVAAAAGAPASLDGVVTSDASGGWQVMAPDAAALDAARTDLGLAAGAAIPLELSTTFAVGGEALNATKRAWLGDVHDNPVVGPVTIDGAAPGDAITVPFDTDVALVIDADPADHVNWLTSCGSLNSDDNEHAVLLHVKPGDETSGDLVVVVRDPEDGVAWQRWPIQSAPPSGATPRSPTASRSPVASRMLSSR